MRPLIKTRGIMIRGFVFFTWIAVACSGNVVPNNPSITGTTLPRDPMTGNGTVMVQVADELLTPGEYDELFHENGSPAEVNRSKRKAAKSSLLRWKNAVVPYQITADFNEEEQKVIQQAFDLYEKTTCLKFRPAESGDKNKMIMHNGPGGCVSMLGMIGGSQNVDLENPGCHFFGLYLHEVGHALGLIHEQQRPDRSKYVRILWRNVQYRLYSAYQKEPKMNTNTYKVPYDLSSVMQYEVSAFANNNEQTLVPIKKWMREWPGRVFWKTLSMSDVLVLNRMYKCTKRCKNKAKKKAAEAKCKGKRGSLIDKDCNCVTPDDHYKIVCVNQNDDDSCFERAHKGDCQKDPGPMNIKCRKACGSCPLFGTSMAKTMAKKYKSKCSNKYWSDEWCKKWADKGDCDKYPWWMKRYCAKACDACKDRLGRCLNLGWGLFDNQMCDSIAEQGKCETDENNKVQCADSCKTCGYEPQGDCKNIKSDKECLKRAGKGDCDKIKTGVDMMTNCAKTCNSCWFNKGKCKNNLDDKVCETGAVVGKCLFDPKVFRAKCQKTCDSCGYGEKGKCDNIWEEHLCQEAFEKNDCDNEGGYYKVFCAKHCNSCDYINGNVPCANLGADDATCDGWAAREECTANSAYMTVNCAKSCDTCYKLNATACYNHHIDYHCDVMIKNEGSCGGYENQMCRKACGVCKSNDKKKPECKDHHSGCKDWAASGECESNPVWMKGVCSFSCELCEKKPSAIDIGDYATGDEDDYGGEDYDYKKK